MGSANKNMRHAQFVSFDWFPQVKIVRALTSDRVGKWRMNHPMINMIMAVEILPNSPSESDSETSGSSSCSSEASNEHSKRAKRRMKRKYVEDSCNSFDTCEPKKRKKNQLGTKRKIVKKKRKSKKKKKSRKAAERLSNRKAEKKTSFTLRLSG